MAEEQCSTPQETLNGDRDVLRSQGDFGSDEEFLRSVLASSSDCIKVIDLDGKLQYMTEAGQRLMEVSDFNAVRGCPWPDFWEGGLNAEALAAVHAAREGGEGRFEGMARTMLGTQKWWDVRVTPMRDATGLPMSLLVVSRDISLQKEAEAKQRLLMEELAHRVKNILAMVQAISLMSLRDGTDITLGREAFNARLAAMAHAQDILLRNTSGTSATIDALLSKIVALHGNVTQFSLVGPEVIVGSSFALAFSLVTHELFTNALKYGALSSESGKVAIAWELAGSSEDQQLAFSWVETGGPLVTTPTRQGFGSRLIERSLAKTPGSSAHVAYDSTGVVFHLKVRVRDILDD